MKTISGHAANNLASIGTYLVKLAREANEPDAEQIFPEPPIDQLRQDEEGPNPYADQPVDPDYWEKRCRELNKIVDDLGGDLRDALDAKSRLADKLTRAQDLASGLIDILIQYREVSR